MVRGLFRKIIKPSSLQHDPLKCCMYSSYGLNQMLCCFLVDRCLDIAVDLTGMKITRTTTLLPATAAGEAMYKPTHHTRPISGTKDSVFPRCMLTLELEDLWEHPTMDKNTR